MTLTLEAVGIDVSVSFDTGTSTNFLSLRLPSGEVVQAAITDSTADLILRARQEAVGGTPRGVARETDIAPHSMHDQFEQAENYLAGNDPHLRDTSFQRASPGTYGDGDHFVFGGDYAPPNTTSAVDNPPADVDQLIQTLTAVSEGHSETEQQLDVKQASTSTGYTSNGAVVPPLIDPVQLRRAYNNKRVEKAKQMALKGDGPTRVSPIPKDDAGNPIVPNLNSLSGNYTAHLMDEEDMQA